MNKTALLSASNKEGITSFAEELLRQEFTILASGGTAKHLSVHGIPVVNIEGMVGKPILDHRVVTLHPKIQGGLLGLESHRAEMSSLDIPWIDLVYVDLYPMHQALRDPNRTVESVLEMTDIGGPTMLMAATKGRRFVVPGREWLTEATEAVRTGAWEKEGVRLRFAKRAVRLVSSYTVGLAAFLEQVAENGGHVPQPSRS